LAFSAIGEGSPKHPDLNVPQWNLRFSLGFLTGVGLTFENWPPKIGVVKASLKSGRFRLLSIFIHGSQA